MAVNNCEKLFSDPTKNSQVFIDNARSFREKGVADTFKQLEIEKMLLSKHSLKSAEIAELLGLQKDSTERFLNVCVYLGLLVKNQDQYSLSLMRNSFDDKASQVILDLAEYFNVSGKVNLKQVDVKTDLTTASELGYVIPTNDGYTINPYLAKYLSRSADSLIPRFLFYRNILRPLYEPNIIISALRQGQSQWARTKHQEVTDPFNFYKQNPELLSHLMASMHGVNNEGDRAIVNSLLPNKNVKILDVGGASGGLADLILSLRPEVKEISIYEKDGAQELLLRIFAERVSPDNQNKIKYIWGSFLKDPDVESLHNLSVSNKFDYIFLGWIIHDWSSPTSISILKKVKSHLKPDGKIVLLDWVMPASKDDKTTLADLDMLLQTEGRERTSDDFKLIAEMAGLNLENIIHPTGGRSGIIMGNSP